VKKHVRQCKLKKGAKVGTWFSKSNVDVSIICRFTAYFVMLPLSCQKLLVFDTGLSSRLLTGSIFAERYMNILLYLYEKCIIYILHLYLLIL